MPQRKNVAPVLPAPQNEREGNQPVHSIRHRNLKAAVWKNVSDAGVIYNVTLTRSYRQDNKWHDTQSFSYSDLMNVAKLLFDTHTYITELRMKDAHNHG